ncbi:unnamed protein product, partial [Mesorhabditis belari]|uniref:Uncharacterized protein n=1 Tax=Mesorhabditis belari TaxID=2138241 RepID=A0AAF3FEI8_9BILA
MERVGLLTMGDYGIRHDDIKYFKMDSIIRGRGPDRLKYLDLEGRWVLSGRKSIPFISQAFRHLENLNDATLPFRDIKEEPLNAIGMIGWTRSSVEPVEQPKEKKLPRFEKPPVFVAEEIPPSPREPLPHRSYGYGPAHEKRRLSVSSARSRSASPRPESPYPEYDKYAKYQRKDSISSLGGGRPIEEGYHSGAPSPQPYTEEEGWLPPHRTQGLSPRPTSRTRKYYDNEYDPTYIQKANKKNDGLSVNTKISGQVGHKYRPTSSLDSMGSSGSEQNSPTDGGHGLAKGRDEVVMIQYEMRAQGQRPQRMTTHRAH